MSTDRPVISVLTDLRDDWRVYWLRSNHENQNLGELVQQRLQRSQAVGFLRYHQELFIRRHQEEIGMRFDNGRGGSPGQGPGAGNSQGDGYRALPGLPTTTALHLHQDPFNNRVLAAGGEGAPGMDGAAEEAITVGRWASQELLIPPWRSARGDDLSGVVPDDPQKRVRDWVADTSKELTLLNLLDPSTE
ncbi:hypothetical protein HK405_000142 [Cladochytrium tenue]|nr:hypothetical protein HK405_000142 [Cladochytrium tenue]